MSIFLSILGFFFKKFIISAKPKKGRQEKIVAPGIGIKDPIKAADMIIVAKVELYFFESLS